MCAVTSENEYIQVMLAFFFHIILNSLIKWDIFKE
jgi:hypothetical protein